MPRTATVTVAGTQGTGQDSGLLLYPGDKLDYSGVGTVTWAPGSCKCGGQAVPGGATPSLMPIRSDLVNYSAGGIVLLPDGVTPQSLPSNGGAQYTVGVYGPAISLTDPVTLALSWSDIQAGNPPDLGAAAAWRVWLLVNDDIPANNSGHFTISLSIEAEPVNPPDVPTITAVGELVDNVPTIHLTIS